MPDEPRFVPAEFEPFEYDDGPPGAGSGPGAARRWFSHWNGLLGRPAHEVALAWSDGRATVLVATSGDAFNREMSRYHLAHLALGGTELGTRPPDLPPPAVPDLLRGVADDDRRWSGTGAEEHIEHDLFAGWYGPRGAVTVFVASSGPLSRGPSVREVVDWADYDVDGSRPFPLSALDR
jgi:hypothetical protein